MSKKRKPAIPSRPAIRFDRLRALSEREGLYVLSSVPLAIFKGAPSLKTVVAPASGVAMRIGPRYFILTAGHVVEIAESNPKHILHVGISRRIPHVFIPWRAASGRSGYRAVDGSKVAKPDMGYFEVPAADVGTMKAQGVVFASVTRAQLPARLLLRDKAGWPVFVGYPEFGIKETPEGGHA